MMRKVKILDQKKLGLFPEHKGIGSVIYEVRGTVSTKWKSWMTAEKPKARPPSKLPRLKLKQLALKEGGHALVLLGVQLQIKGIGNAQVFMLSYILKQLSFYTILP